MQGSASFGIFLDSCPDRWGRLLMTRREAQRARAEGRSPRRLEETDFLLGVCDVLRPGGLRFRTDGPFLDESREQPVPPWASLRALEGACQELERDDAEEDPDYGAWLRMLVAPGSSLGGARPKAGVLDEEGHLWIAKFPSRSDTHDVGAWEGVLHDLAALAGVETPETRSLRLRGPHRTFLSRRFDRAEGGVRLHVASAMTLLERQDGDGAAEGATYLELAELLLQRGARPGPDLEQLWRRIAFSVCVSNTDDHLRNHAFLLVERGWALAPAYDLNPDPDGEGLALNLSDTDNAQDLGLVRQIAPFFRVKPARADEILTHVITAVRGWRAIARGRGLSTAEQDRMARAFRAAEAG